MGLFYTSLERQKFDLLGELFVAMEPANEQAFLYFEFYLTDALSISQDLLKNSLRVVFEAKPKLASTAHWYGGHLQWRQSANLDDSVANSFLGPEASDIKNISREILHEQPLYVQWLSEKNFRLAIHHSISDGYGCMAIGYALVETARSLAHNCPNESLQVLNHVATANRKSRGPGPGFWWWLLMFFWRRSRLAKSDPPVILGQRSVDGDICRGHIHRVLSAEQAVAIRSRLKKAHPEVSLNDWMMCSLVVAMDQLLESLKRPADEHGERIAIYVPLSVRSELDADPLWNCLSGGQVDLKKAQRTDRKKMLIEIVRQTQVLKQMKNRLRAYWLFVLLHRISWKFKWNLAKTSPEGWRHACTACFSNVGRLAFLDRSSDVIQSISCAPATLAPNGFMVGVVNIGEKICFGFNYADYCVDEMEARFIVDRFFANLELV